MDLEKLAQEKTEMQRHYVMVGRADKNHSILIIKQTCCKRNNNNLFGIVFFSQIFHFSITKCHMV